MALRSPTWIVVLAALASGGCVSTPVGSKSGPGVTLSSTIEGDLDCRRVTTTSGSEVRCDTAQAMAEADRRNALIDAGLACRDPFVSRDGCRSRLERQGLDGRSSRDRESAP